MKTALKEAMMRSSLVVGMLALMAGSALTHGGAQAASLGIANGGLRTTAQNLNLLEDVVYVWGGRNYCWYDDGWQGPGWYVCNYGPWVSGLWWGGGYRWNNWHGGHSHDWYVRHGHHDHHNGHHYQGGDHHKGSNHYKGSDHHKGSAHKGGGGNKNAMHKGGGHKGGGHKGGGHKHR